MKADWHQADADEWHFEVQAEAFLYRMVRRLVFVQVAVAQGKCRHDATAPVSAEVISRSLAKQFPAGEGSELPAGLAPAHGLTLVEVTYPNNIESIGQ